MTTVYKHTRCLRELREVERLVISQPEDQSWPHDFKSKMLFCDACQRTVSHDEVKLHFTS